MFLPGEGVSIFGYSYDNSTLTSCVFLFEELIRYETPAAGFVRLKVYSVFLSPTAYSGDAMLFEVSLIVTFAEALMPLLVVILMVFRVDPGTAGVAK